MLHIVDRGGLAGDFPSANGNSFPLIAMLHCTGGFDWDIKLMIPFFFCHR